MRRFRHENTFKPEAVVGIQIESVQSIQSVVIDTFYQA